MMHMRTTLNINEELLHRARELTGIREKTTLLHEGLHALIERQAARYLASMGGSQPTFKAGRRRRSAKASRPSSRTRRG